MAITISARAANAPFISCVRSPCRTARWHLVPFVSKTGGISPFKSIAGSTGAGERGLGAFPSHPPALPPRAPCRVVSCRPRELLRASSGEGGYTRAALQHTLHQLGREHLPAAPRLTARQARSSSLPTPTTAALRKGVARYNHLQQVVNTKGFVFFHF